jgi:hypothetical protein
MAKATTQYGILDTVAQRVTPTAHDPQGAKPSITVDAHAGTSATAALSGDSTDFAGKITLVTGSAGWAAGSQLKVLFGTPFSAPPKVVLTPADATAAATFVTHRFIATPLTDGTGFTVDVGAGGTVDSGAATSNFFYSVNSVQA